MTTPGGAGAGTPAPAQVPAAGAPVSTRPALRPALLAAVALVVLGGDAWLVQRLIAVRAEAHQARVDAYGVDGAATDAAMAAQKARLQAILDRVRAEAAADRGLHLSIEVDSGTVTLERDGLVLRTMDADIGPESLVGTPPDTQRLAAPRGVRTVQRIVAKGATFELPAWLYRERGIEAPADRRVKGALGAGAAFLDGGAVLYAMPAEGPLADSLYVWPGAIRISPADLKAVLPNLKPGVKVYLY
ncbi:MAG: hypothetical protein HYX65_06110 [Gemmatimonadetes bacterium]|nr:hypothetical protein [Gemmatimonadota bacterium]